MIDEYDDEDFEEECALVRDDAVFTESGDFGFREDGDVRHALNFFQQELAQIEARDGTESVL